MAITETTALFANHVTKAAGLASQVAPQIAFPAAPRSLSSMAPRALQAAEMASMPMRGTSARLAIRAA